MPDSSALCGYSCLDLGERRNGIRRAHRFGRHSGCGRGAAHCLNGCLAAAYRSSKITGKGIARTGCVDRPCLIRSLIYRHCAVAIYAAVTAEREHECGVRVARRKCLRYLFGLLLIGQRLTLAAVYDDIVRSMNLLVTNG